LPRIAVTVTRPDPEAEADTRFGRAPYFMLYDTGNEEWESLANPALEAGGGAGVQAAQYLADRRIEAVVSGAFGPNAFTVLQAAGIAMYHFDTPGTCRELIEAYQSGRLAQASSASRRGRSGGRRA
jgi:predicted Fe-Mo cluster-binding NifX family protein